MRTSTPTKLALTSILVSLTSAHVALWDPGMYGWDASNPNQQDPINPLMNLDFNSWWFHGYINTPPPEGSFMTLPAGGTYHGQVACNKAYTTYGGNSSLQSNAYACDSIGPLHTADAYGTDSPTDVKGCGMAIAYESDVTKIQPEDFAVISTNYTCPWKKDVDFQIPSDLPACPEGGCHCMWGWIHSADSGSEQMYFIGYRCNVTGATNTQAIPAPATANKCDYPTDTSNCTVGAKQPHYWFQAERNNNPQGTYDPPFYNDAYGFMNGAQTDLFAGNGTAPASTPVLSVSSTVSSTSSSSSSSASAYSTPSTQATEATTSSAASSISYTSTSQTTVYITTTIESDGISATATANLLAIATGVDTSSSATPSSTSSSSVSQCKRKRSLDNATPEEIERHLKRKQRRRERLAKKRIEQGTSMAQMRP